MHADCEHDGAKACDDVGLRRRPAELRGEQGYLAIVKQAAVDAGKQEMAIARNGLTEADKWKNQIGASLVTSAERSIAARKP